MGMPTEQFIKLYSGLKAEGKSMAEIQDGLEAAGVPVIRVPAPKKETDNETGSNLRPRSPSSFAG